MAKTIGFVSLGCAKNQVNSEQMIYLLDQAGYQLTTRVENVDVVVVNTCGFIDSAKSEAIAEIIELGKLKEEGKIGKILVAGCLSQRYQDELMQELPEVDGVLGTGSYNDIVAAVDEVLAGQTPRKFADINAPLDEGSRVLTTPNYFAYLKIAEGCDNRCSFCIIPYLRGKYRSRDFDELVQEAKDLAAGGVRELIVVAQDISRYGIDRYGRYRLAELLEELCKIPQLRWIRLHYLYPDEIDDNLIDLIAREDKIVKYLDIPIQHVNDTILKRMNRRGSKAYLDELFTKLRARIPGLVLRTSLIAGLPGEGEEEFDELCQFLRKHKLERVGAFVFSPEEGTPAAKMEYPDQETAERRVEILVDLQSRIMDEYNESKLGQTVTVLCEGYDRLAECHFGRTYADSPDIDGKVFFDSPVRLREGSFVEVEITEIMDGDLVGVAHIETEEDKA
jgi:ribosomal protein S12 methylthiotransferase